MKQSDLIERMYEVCADAITLATQLSRAPDLPAPEVLRQRIGATFDNLRQRAAHADIPSSDAMEAIYAIAAFMDEQILRSPWPARQQWMAQPLQLVYFQENTAGEGFYDRLAQLETNPEKVHVLSIYYYCLALGFQGKYAVGYSAEHVALQERAQAVVGRRLPSAETLSPGGYPKQQRQLSLNPKQFPVIGAAIGFLALSLLVYFVLVITIGVSADNAAEKIRASAGAEPGRVAKTQEESE